MFQGLIVNLITLSHSVALKARFKTLQVVSRHIARYCMNMLPGKLIQKVLIIESFPSKAKKCSFQMKRAQ